MNPVIDWENAARYAEEHTTQPDRVLYELDRWVHLYRAQPRMAAGAYQGKLLEFLTSMTRPLKAVEVGSFVGYSTICIARGLAPEGTLHAIEIDEECEPVIRRNLAQAHLSDKVSLHIADAQSVIPTLGDNIDFAFIDADKTSTRHHYDLLVPRMRQGGVILIDNVMWSGKVLVPHPATDHDTARFKAFNDYIQSDPRVENIFLPLRDGLLLCRVV